MKTRTLTVFTTALVALLAAVAVSLAGAPDAKADRTITLSSPNIQCPKCKQALETSLRAVKGVTEIGVDPRAKTILVSYDHHFTSAARLASHAAATKPLHGKPYESALLLTADMLTKEVADKLIAALKGFKSPLDTEPVADVSVDVDKKLISISFKPIKLDERERGTDIGPLLNAAKKILPTVKAVALEKK